jgi:hypothetical protein
VTVWNRATVYVAAHDLALLLHGSLTATSALAHEVRRRAVRLVEVLAVALSFPDRRTEALRRADELACGLRVVLRLVHDVGDLGAGALRRAAAELDVIGRMIGGWRRARRRCTASHSHNQGTGPRLRARRARGQLEQPGGELPIGVPQQQRPSERER